MPFALHHRDKGAGPLGKRCNAKGIAPYGLMVVAACHAESARVRRDALYALSPVTDRVVDRSPIGRVLPLLDAPLE